MPIDPMRQLLCSGTSGLVLPVPQSLYPPEFHGRSRLEYYASMFNSVEINSSFYKMPRTATIKKWIDSVPDHFQFTFKLPKEISHAKGLIFNPELVENFMNVIEVANDKRGCLLVQFPPSLKFDLISEVERLLISINSANLSKWKIAVEFRNTSWYNDELYALLDKHNACMVQHDLPASAAPDYQPIINFEYFRFHGPEGTYRGSYSNDFLIQKAQEVKIGLQKGKQVYCYFNNTMGDAIKNLQTLNDHVNS